MSEYMHFNLYHPPKETPCFKCEERAIGCHTECEKYAEYRKTLEREKDAFYKEKARSKLTDAKIKRKDACDKLAKAKNGKIYSGK